MWLSGDIMWPISILYKTRNNAITFAKLQKMYHYDYGLFDWKYNIASPDNVREQQTL